MGDPPALIKFGPSWIMNEINRAQNSANNSADTNNVGPSNASNGDNTGAAAIGPANVDRGGTSGLANVSSPPATTGAPVPPTGASSPTARVSAAATSSSVPAVRQPPVVVVPNPTVVTTRASSSLPATNAPTAHSASNQSRSFETHSGVASYGATRKYYNTQTDNRQRGYYGDSTGYRQPRPPSRYDSSFQRYVNFFFAIFHIYLHFDYIYI